MKKSELKEIRSIIIDEGKLFDKDYDKLDMQSGFDNKIKLVWMWVRQGKIKKWTELSDAVHHIGA